MKNHPMQRTSKSKIRSKLGFLLLVVVAVSACFTGSGLAGFPCERSSDCGPRFVCQQGICVGRNSASTSDEESSSSSHSSMSEVLTEHGSNSSDSSTTTNVSNTTEDSSSTDTVSSTGEVGCGDGQVQTGEECDPGPEESAECDADCTWQKCGDLVINEAAKEECEGDSPVIRGVCDSKACVIECTGFSWRNCNFTGKDGCEANILVDPKNCGGCGNICGDNFECIEGDCI